MAREIEVKFRLTEEQGSLLTTWLDKNALFEHETHHIETYLDNPEKPFLFQNKNGFKDSEHYLRVRKDFQKGSSVCLKLFQIDQDKQTSQNVDEVEFSVSDDHAALKLFKTLGYTSETVIDKTRKIYLTMDNKFEICIDDVKGLGTFAEVELKQQIDGDIQIGFKMIYEFLLSLGIDTIDVQTRGYVSMLWNPEIDFGKIKSLRP